MPVLPPDTGPPLTGPRFFPAAAALHTQREQNLRYADQDSVIEFVHESSWKGNELFRPLNDKSTDSPIQEFDASRIAQWTRSAANARRRALDLAEGIGVLGDPEDIHTFVQPPGSVHDDRRRPGMGGRHLSDIHRTSRWHGEL